MITQHCYFRPLKGSIRCNPLCLKLGNKLRKVEYFKSHSFSAWVTKKPQDVIRLKWTWEVNTKDRRWILQKLKKNEMLLTDMEASRNRSFPKQQNDILVSSLWQDWRPKQSHIFWYPLLPSKQKFSHLNRPKSNQEMQRNNKTLWNFYVDTNVGSRICIVNSILWKSIKSQTYKWN